MLSPRLENAKLLPEEHKTCSWSRWHKSWRQEPHCSGNRSSIMVARDGIVFRTVTAPAGTSCLRSLGELQHLIALLESAVLSKKTGSLGSVEEVAGEEHLTSRASNLNGGWLDAT